MVVKAAIQKVVAQEATGLEVLAYTQWNILSSLVVSSNILDFSSIAPILETHSSFRMKEQTGALDETHASSDSEAIIQTEQTKHTSNEQFEKMENEAESVYLSKDEVVAQPLTDVEPNFSENQNSQDLTLINASFDSNSTSFENPLQPDVTENHDNQTIATTTVQNDPFDALDETTVTNPFKLARQMLRAQKIFKKSLLKHIPVIPLTQTDLENQQQSHDHSLKSL